MMKNILLPTDFSDNSWNAIKYALQLFKDEKCTFHLLNTFTPVIYNVEYLQVSSAQFGLVDAMKEVSTKGLKTMSDRINKEFKNPNHKISEISSFNLLIEEIRELDRAHLIDFIVMGTKGATGAKEILFGSNTIHVLKSVKCPVLAIPSDFEYETPLEILFPTDFNINYNKSHINPIKAIAKQYNSRVNVLHVSTGYDLTEMQYKNMKTLEASLKDIANIFHEVRNQNIDDAINEFQIKAKINLLIMINNKHSFFENLFFKSTINKIGLHLNIPFLVIPSIIDKK